MDLLDICGVSGTVSLRVFLFVCDRLEAEMEIYAGRKDDWFYNAWSVFQPNILLGCVRGTSIDLCISS